MDSFFIKRYPRWAARRELEHLEREAQAELFKPVRMADMNPPALLEPTRCRVRKAFRVGGRRVAPGEVCTLPHHDAISMRALGKVEFL